VKTDLLDGLVGEGKDNNVNCPRDEEHDHGYGMLSGEKAEVSEAEKRLHDEDGGHG